MSRLNVCGLLIGFAVLSGGLVIAQDCGCAGAAVGGHRHFWPGPYGGPNCGRGYNQAQAESLWAGYCSENCSLCGGHGAGCGTGLLVDCGDAECSNGSGPFAGLPHVRQNLHGIGGQSGSHFGTGAFTDGRFVKLGAPQYGVAGSCGPCNISGKVAGRSVLSCQQWGWSSFESSCGCSSCDSGNVGHSGHFTK